MLTLTGEVRKILPSSYTSRKTGEEINQAVLILEPSGGRQNYEVNISAKQLQDGAVSIWERLKGKQASVEVSLYVNHEHKFQKFTAVTAKPLENR